LQEWPVAALDSVPKDIAQEVQDALLALQFHYDAHKKQIETGVWDPVRCDTSPELASLAYGASTVGNLAGFRSARSYFEVRTMQEAAGFVLKDDKGNWQCKLQMQKILYIFTLYKLIIRDSCKMLGTRAATLYDSIQCPPDHYKLPIEEYEVSCSNQGLMCKEGYDCYCKPCIKAFEVDVFEWTTEMQNSLTRAIQVKGCDKMSLCGSVEQTKSIILRIVDNKKRENPHVQAKM
jgi:hypothetical protein